MLLCFGSWAWETISLGSGYSVPLFPLSIQSCLSSECIFASSGALDSEMLSSGNLSYSSVNVRFFLSYINHFNNHTYFLYFHFVCNFELTYVSFLPKCIYLRNIFPCISALFYYKSEEEKSICMLYDLEISSAKQLSPLLLNSPSLKFIWHGGTEEKNLPEYEGAKAHSVIVLISLWNLSTRPLLSAFLLASGSSKLLPEWPISLGVRSGTSLASCFKLFHITFTNQFQMLNTTWSSLLHQQSHSLVAICCISYLVVVTRFLARSNLKEEGFILAHGLRVQFIMVGRIVEEMRPLVPVCPQLGGRERRMLCFWFLK